MISIMSVKRVKQQEEGLVSIIITMIIMIVLSLIVVGFAQLARREQRDTLDRQLSSQAFYAAESGINNAQNAIKAGFQGNIEECSDAFPAPYTAFNDKVLDTASDTQYSCVLIDQTPPTLTYDSIKIEKSKIIKIDAKDKLGAAGVSVNLNGLEFYWQRQGLGTFPTSPFKPLGEFPAVSSWPADMPGVLRIDLVPVPDAASYEQASLATNNFTVFAYPTAGGGLASYASGLASQGSVVAGECQNVSPNVSHPQYCKLKVSLPSTTGKYYARVSSIYADSSLSIRGTYTDSVTLSSTVGARFAGEQAIIDATGKANDVLKRVKVGRSLSPGVSPDAERAIQSAGSLCKLLSVYPPNPPTSPGYLEECSWPGHETPSASN